MLGLVRVANAKIIDICDIPLQLKISFVDKIDDTIINDCSFFECEQFNYFIAHEKPERLYISCNTQEEFDYLINSVKDFVVSLKLNLKRTAYFNLTVLENVTNLEAIQFYANLKITKLWNLRKNTRLKYFDMMEYNLITDFSVFENSSVESLTLHGCNHCSSFKSKLHIKDFEFVLKMPKLKRLNLDIVKDNSDEYYLSILSKLTNLERLFLPDAFFTFQQFAWLSSKLPNVTHGLEACFYFKSLNCYNIIGFRKPRLLKNKDRVALYTEEYEALKIKYQTQDYPPSKDDI